MQRGTTYIDPFMREARRHSRAFFFRFAKEYRELLDGGHRNVTTVVAGQEGLQRESV